MEVEWSCYGGGQFKGGRIIVTEVGSLKEGEWSCYRSGRFNGSGQFKRGRMVVTEVARGRIVMIQRWSVNGGGMVVIEVASISYL